MEGSVECPECGKRSRKGSTFCMGCGNRLPNGHVPVATESADDVLPEVSELDDVPDLGEPPAELETLPETDLPEVVEPISETTPPPETPTPPTEKEEGTSSKKAVPLAKSKVHSKAGTGKGANLQSKKHFIRRLKIEPSFFKEALILIPRTILRELRKWLYFLPWVILGIILFIFPLTLPLAPFIWFLIMTWIVAIESVSCFT